MTVNRTRSSVLFFVRTVRERGAEKSHRSSELGATRKHGVARSRTSDGRN